MTRIESTETGPRKAGLRLVYLLSRFFQQSRSTLEYSKVIDP